MEEQINILLKTIDGLNATIATLSENHRKEVETLNQRIKELTALHPNDSMSFLPISLLISC